MSKLATAVLAHGTQRRQAMLSPRLLTVTEELMPFDDFKVGTVYTIRATVGITAVISGTKEIAPVTRTARMSIVEDVFGEFRPYFHRIDEALWNQNIDEARKLLHEFKEKMFSVDND